MEKLKNINGADVSGDTSEMNPQLLENETYKTKYRELKETLKTNVAKNEYLKSELKLSQKKLQFLEEDKFFLCERLLVFEQPVVSPQPTPNLSDCDSEGEGGAGVGQARGRGRATSLAVTHPGGVTFSSAFSKAPVCPPLLSFSGIQVKVILPADLTAS